MPVHSINARDFDMFDTIGNPMNAYTRGDQAPTIIVQPKPGARANIFFYPHNEPAYTLARLTGNKTLTRRTLNLAEEMGLKLATVHMGQTIPTTYEALAEEYPV